MRYQEETRRIMKELGGYVEKIDSTIWIVPPESLYLDHDPRDPYYDNHYCYDWTEAYERACKYQRIFEFDRELQFFCDQQEQLAEQRYNWRQPR